MGNIREEAVLVIPGGTELPRDFLRGAGQIADLIPVFYGIGIGQIAVDVLLERGMDLPYRTDYLEVQQDRENNQ